MKSSVFWLSAMLVIVFTLGFVYQATSNEPANLSPFRQFPGLKDDLSQSMRFAEFNLVFQDAVRQKMEATRLHLSMQQQIRQLPAGQKMATFIDMFSRSGIENPAAHAQMLQNLSSPRLLKGSAGGSITGQVTVGGGSVFTVVEVLAFDQYGFPAGGASAEIGAGNYAINNLEPGSYYVVTSSQFIDEFYGDVPLDFYRNWRDASLVTVTDATVAVGIDFDLAAGATVSGTIFAEDGATPLAFSSVDFKVTSAQTPDEPIDIFTFTDDEGKFAMTVPLTGDINIKAEITGGGSDVRDVTIPSADAELDGIDFAVSEGGSVTRPGSVIRGSVMGPNSEPVALAFVFSFDLADTSISGFTLTGFDGTYELAGLGGGTHILFANYYLDGLAEPAVEGEYYEDAKTPTQATPLVTTGQDTLLDKNFSLDPGGEISGEITDANSAKLDSVLVIALRADVLSDVLTSPNLLLLTEADFGLGISELDGTYSIPGLSSGNYILRTVSLLKEREAPVLDEYYGGVYSLFDFLAATPVVVTSPDATSGIDFDLDIGATISGHFYENGGSTPVEGEGFVLALNAETDLPELAFPIYSKQDGSFVLGPLPTGQYKLFGFVSPADSGDGLFDLGGLGKASAQNDSPVYLPQFYDGKTSFADADPVEVTAPNLTPDIDFGMVRASGISGVVNLPTGNPVGADTLEALMIVAYDAATGDVAGGTEATFAGGYQLRGLPPGGYKVAALPATHGYAGTYHGGGTAFDSPDATVVTLLPDEKKSADIQLAEGLGSISGDVTDSNGLPLSGVLVIAYDQTGHAVSAGLSGFDIHSNVPNADPSAYKITGLAPGQYYLRTVSLFRFLQAFEGLDVGGEGLGNDPFSLLFGLLGLGTDLGSSLDLQLHQDQWYDAQPITIDLEGLDIFSLVFGLLSSDGNPDLLLPLYDVAPSGAQTVSVSGPVSDIDFVLSKTDLSVSVEESEARVPDGFELSQNYPNPFNPNTQLTVSVPGASTVKIAVYNTLGQRIRTLFDGHRNAGSFTLRWDSLDGNGLPVSSGIYLVRMETGGKSISRKMLLVR